MGIIRRSRDNWQRTGTIITRWWESGLDEQSYRELCVGGKKRLAQPDGFTYDGRPIYVLSDYEERQQHLNKNRHCTEVAQIHNIACNDGRNALLNFLAGSGSPTGINYFAVGTGYGTPSSTDHTLFVEAFRKNITIIVVTGNQVDLNTVFASGEANGPYTEAGLFGNGATITANTGTLFAHALYPYSKQIGITLTNDYYLSLT